MQGAFCSADDDSMHCDHYVAFLSEGNGKEKKEKRLKKHGTRIATLTAIIISAALVTTCLFILFANSHFRSTPLSFHNESAIAQQSASVSSIGKGSLLATPEMLVAFESFISKQEKHYDSVNEKAHRFEIFLRNMLFIDMTNAQNYSYTLAPNAFTDLTFEEFKGFHFTGYRQIRTLKGAGYKNPTDHSLLSINEESLPSEIDWNLKGCVSKVKSQKKCGSCWAFSASGAVEGAYCAKYGTLKELSEQQLVDCGNPEGNNGCNGGDMDFAFQYIMDRGGLCNEEDYPYMAKKGRCVDKECTPAAKISHFSDVPKKNEVALKAAIAQHGPVSVAIEADQLPFQFYHSGVFDASCGKKLDHGVLAIGYGTDSISGKDYWLIKNSWGPEWGDNGFIKLSRKSGPKAGECGVLLEPSYPIVL